MNYTGSMILFIFLVQLAAYTLKWLIGFGNPLISAPLLAMRLDNTLITPGSLLPDLVINGRITWQSRNNFRWRAILPLLLAMVVMYTLGQSTVNLFIALSLTSWASVARVVRSQTLSLKELAGYPLICLNEESMTRSFYRQFFLEHDAVLKPDTEAATTDQMLTLVKSELGLAFMPEPMAAPLLASGELVQLHLQEIIPSRSICLVYDHHRPLNTAARKFQQLLTKAGTRSAERK